MWHSEFKLYLYPVNSSHIVDLEALQLSLQKLALTGEKLSSIRYSTGNHFLSLLTFMGCSPNIALEPQDDKPYCYIEIESVQQAQFVSGKNTKFPACPHCKESLKNTVCASCNKALDLAKLNWRKSAFFASSWITIGNIYELEAIPSDQLLDALEVETNTKWKYAYVREDRK